MKAHDILYALGDIDRDLVERAEGKHKTKRFLLRLLAAAACFCILLAACVPATLIYIFTHLEYGGEDHQYKRIDLSAEALGDADETINFFTKIESNVTDTFATTMPIYEITPRTITDEDVLQFSDHFNVTGTELIWHTSSAVWFGDQRVFRDNGNELKYDNHANNSYDPMTQSDEEIVAQAIEIFEDLPLIEGEYECLGVLSTQTQQDCIKDGDDYIVGEKYIVSKRVVFRKKIDGIRILGDEFCSMYFNSKGLYTLRMEFYDYTKVGEIPMLSLDDAIDKIKDADAFSVETDGTTFSGIADKLNVERVKLLYVNQYSNGCTILQPVFNLMGTAENDTGKAEFSAKIIAIPKKYTYEDD